MTTVEVHIEGSITVLLMPDGIYEAHIRWSGGCTVRMGRGTTPKLAIEEALN